MNKYYLRPLKYVGLRFTAALMASARDHCKTCTVGRTQEGFQNQLRWVEWRDRGERDTDCM